MHAMDRIQQIADKYLPRIAARRGCDPGDLYADARRPRKPYETRPAIVWVGQEVLDDVLAANPGSEQLASDDAAVVRGAWPADHPLAGVDRWCTPGPEAENRVAVALVPL